MSGQCRICLIKVEFSERVNIFTESRNNELISDMLINFASIVVHENDDLPKFVCLNCLNKLYSSYDFRNLIIKSYSDLKDQLNLMETGTCKSDTEENETDELLIKHEKEEENGIIKEDNALEKSGDEVENLIKNSISMNEKNSNDKISSKMKYKRKSYGCTVCKATFKNSYRVAVHKRMHTGTFPYCCEVCNKGFPTKYAMTVHKNIHFEERPFKCEDCDKSFKAPASLLIHKKVHLDTRPYQCKTCGRRFAQSGGLKTHELTHTKEKDFICEFCSKRFTQGSYLTKHLKTHSETRRPCPVCGKTYARLTLHLKCHSDDKTKKFSCEVCNKKFTLRNTLNIHMRIHEGVKPYSCTLCDAKFTQSTCLVRHMRTHTGETPYPCSYCNMRFSYTHHRLKHMKKEHPDEKSE